MSAVSRWSYKDVATVWAPTGKKDHLNGGNLWGVPFEIACTWTADTKMMRDNGGNEFISMCSYYHEDARVNHGMRILRGSHNEPDPIAVGAEEIKAHREWNMSMFKSKGKKDIPDFLSAV